MDENLAAIQVQVIGIKNIGAHKSVQILCECPVEYAESVVARLGWPTRVDPVPCVLARLVDAAT